MKFDFRESVAFALVQAAKAHFRAAGAALAEHGLQVGQDLLLIQLWQEEGLTQSELVRRLSVEPPTVTRALGRLQRAGLVTRRRDPADARALRVYLTASGRRLEGPVTRVWAELDARERAALTEEEQRVLCRVTRRLRDLLAPSPAVTRRRSRG